MRASAGSAAARSRVAGAGRLSSALLGATLAGSSYVALRHATATGRVGGLDVWGRTNHRGEPVTLVAGPALAAGATLSAASAPGLPARVRVAVLAAGAGGGCLGGYDDLKGSGDDRGLRGHFRALRRGEVTTGLVKVVGLGATGLLAGTLLRRGAAERLCAAGVIAGLANLVNLLDLRPGRAGKAALILAAPSLARPGVAGAVLAGPAAAVGCLLVPDLREQAMLGDAGANALGALLGVASVSRATRRSLIVQLGVIAALTLASEKVSFTRVIAATPLLREIDQLGRRPSPPPR